MRFKGFIGPSYTLQSLNVDCQRALNLYPEIDELLTGSEGEVASLVSTPGLRLLCALPTGPVRANYTDSSGQLWVVGGNTVYHVSSLWVATAIGTMNTSSGPVSMSDNGSEVVLVDGPYGYSWTLNISLNALPPQYTSTKTTGGTTTLTASSSFQQYFTGPDAQTVVLPVVSTLVQGIPVFNIVNLTGNVITVQTSGLDVLATINPSFQLAVTCVNNQGDANIDSWSTASSPITGNTFYQIQDPNFRGADQVSFMDGYFIFNQPDSQIVYNGPQSAVIPFDATNVDQIQAQPENVVGHVELQEYLYFFSKNHFEVWYDAAADSFPLARVQGSVSEFGCVAAFSIQKIQNMVYWLGQDKTGKGAIFQAQALQPQRISTFAIENMMAQLGDLSGARAWSYSQAGHSFYCLNLPGATTTWVFDTLTNLWHERAHLAGGLYQRHLADCHSYAYSTNVVGDYSNGNLYALDQTVFTDNGQPLIRERTSPHLSKDMVRIFHNQFQLDLECGVGVDGGAQGTNPQVMLQWSNDFGNTWSNEHWRGFGPIGIRSNRTIWRRLGNARDRVYRVLISDPVKVTLLGAEIDIEQGES